MSDDEGKQQAEEGPATSSLEPPEPVPSTPIAPREDQIQNAVTFLSHPKASFLCFCDSLVSFGVALLTAIWRLV